MHIFLHHVSVRFRFLLNNLSVHNHIRENEQYQETAYMNFRPDYIGRHRSHKKEETRNSHALSSIILGVLNCRTCLVKTGTIKTLF